MYVRIRSSEQGIENIEGPLYHIRLECMERMERIKRMEHGPGAY